MGRLISRLSLPEAVGLSLSIICPSVTAAFNVTLVAQATGQAAPLAFAIATIAMALIGLSFTAFSHRVAHAGSAGNYYAYTSTIGVLALILVYIGVGGAEMVEAWREHRPLWSAACVLGPVLLLWVLYRNIYPVPEFPSNLWSYVAAGWVIVAGALTRLRPAVTSSPLVEYS